MTYDIAPTSGNIAIMDYVDGRPTNSDVYLADKDGNNVQLLLDLKTQNSLMRGDGALVAG